MKLFRFKDGRRGRIGRFGEERPGVYSATSPSKVQAAEVLAEEGLIEWLPSESIASETTALDLSADTQPEVAQPRRRKRGERS